MTTISGTATTPATTDVTLQNLIDSVQTALGDTAEATWSEAAITIWLNDAIREYSVHFQRIRTTNLTAVADQYIYNLPYGHRQTISVEYPAGNSPPTFLRNKALTDPLFWSDDDNFATTNQGDNTAVNKLTISVNPTTDETITIKYKADHTYPLTAAQSVTVPAHHHNLLILYAIWKANQEMLYTEQQSPTDSSSLIMSQLAANTNRLEASYQEALERALFEPSGQSRVIQWQPTGQDRIY